LNVGSGKVLIVGGIASHAAGSAAAPTITATGDTNTGIFFPSADTIAFSEGGAEAMRIDSSGNLLVGTTSASGNSKFQIAKAGINATSLTTTTIQNLGTRLGFSGVTNSNGYIYGGIAMGGEGEEYAGIAAYDNGASAATGLKFFTGTAGGIVDAVTIDSLGNLLVGTTDSPATLLTDGFAGVAISASNWLVASRFNNPVAYFKRENSNGDAVVFLRDATTVGSISVTTTATSFNTSSDYRLKNTIAPMTGALDKVALLKPVTYKWKADGSDGEGFIAHELQAVVPDCVTGEKDAVDADGNPVYQGIDTSFLVATLTAAIQELKVIVDTQAARITALEAK
jgi:hypothetical protein